MITRNAKRPAPNPLKVDPTRTQTLRSAMIAEMRRRFARLRLAVTDLVDREDAFGVRAGVVGNVFCPTGPGGGVDPTCSPGGRSVIGKGNSGEVYREGDMAVKPARRPDGTLTKEGEFYDELRGTEGIAPGRKVGEEIHLPFYQEVLSVDTVPDERTRRSMGDVVGPNKNRLLNAANAMSERGIDYNDPLQVGYDDEYKAHVIDFSNAGRVPHREALRANIERTARYLDDFGAGTAADHVLRSFGVYNFAQGLSGGSPATAERRVNALAEKGNRVAEHLKSIGAARLAGYDVAHVYYATNPRPVLRDVLQSEPDRDGLKVIISNRPLDDDTIRQYSLTPVVHPSRRTLTTNALTVNERWRFLSRPAQLRAFTAWLRDQARRGILGGATPTDNDLWQRYVEAGWRKGAGRAFDDTRRARRQVPVTAGGGAGDVGSLGPTRRDDFVRLALNQPVSVEKVEVLASRVYTELEGVTDAMAQTMTRTLTDGLVQGKSPRDIGRDLAANVDGIGRQRGELIAQTEIIRAHSEGQLTALEMLGVEEVGVMVEWIATPDAKTCPACRAMEGVVLKISEARGRIPLHPRCRCSWTPANVGEGDKGQKRTKAAIDRAVAASRKAGGTAPRRRIAKKRPTSILGNATNGKLPHGEGVSLVPVSPDLLAFSRFLADHLIDNAVCRDVRGRFASCGGTGQTSTAEDRDIPGNDSISRQIRGDARTRAIADGMATLGQRVKDVDARAEKIRADIKRAEERVRAAERAKGSSTKAGRAKTREEVEKENAHRDRLRKNREERERLQQMARDRLALPPSQRGDMDATFSGDDFPSATGEIGRGIAFAHSVMASDLYVKVEVKPHRRGDSLIVNEMERAHYSHRAFGERSVVRLPDESHYAANSTVHEIGHGIEYQNSRVRRAAEEFLRRRTRGDTPRPMNEVGEGYKADEQGRDDNFARAFGGDRARGRYTGKEYSDGATEIISMGIEQLHRDPIGFATGDPEYFRFMVGVLHGRVRE